jgi:hypothetical protein
MWLRSAQAFWQTRQRVRLSCGAMCVLDRWLSFVRMAFGSPQGFILYVRKYGLGAVACFEKVKTTFSIRF